VSQALALVRLLRGPKVLMRVLWTLGRLSRVLDVVVVVRPMCVAAANLLALTESTGTQPSLRPLSLSLLVEVLDSRGQKGYAFRT